MIKGTGDRKAGLLGKTDNRSLSEREELQKKLNERNKNADTVSDNAPKQELNSDKEK